MPTSAPFINSSLQDILKVDKVLKKRSVVVVVVVADAVAVIAVVASGEQQAGRACLSWQAGTLQLLAAANKKL
jgi:hypothetical protein